MNLEGAHKTEADRFLVRRIQEGDEDSFRQLVARFTGRLSAYARRKLGRGSADVDDAVQETFLGLLTNLSRLGEVRSLEAYLFTILKHKLADLVRKSPRAHGLVAVPIEGTESRPGLELPARDAPPSHHARQEEAMALRRQVLSDILAAALATLKEEKSFRELKILELIFYCGQKGKDVARLVGTSEPTVARTKTEAIERLGRLARRHPRGDPSLGLFEPGEEREGLLSEVWRENLLSCLKRSTLGAYTLGVLEPEWKDYVAFHLDTVGCEACAANLDDLQQGKPPTAQLEERVFASSVGFLRQKKR